MTYDKNCLSTSDYSRVLMWWFLPRHGSCWFNVSDSHVSRREAGFLGTNSGNSSSVILASKSQHPCASAVLSHNYMLKTCLNTKAPNPEAIHREHPKEFGTLGISEGTLVSTSMFYLLGYTLCKPRKSFEVANQCQSGWEDLFSRKPDSLQQ